MKNIHLLPTDKPSRLHLGNSGLVLCDLEFGKNTINGQHIYITNSEQIKEGERGLSINDAVYTHFNHLGKDYGKKIILTTDQNLIADEIEQISEDMLLKIIEHINSGKNINSFDEL